MQRHFMAFLGKKKSKIKIQKYSCYAQFQGTVHESSNAFWNWLLKKGTTMIPKPWCIKSLVMWDIFANCFCAQITFRCIISYFCEAQPQIVNFIHVLWDMPHHHCRGKYSRSKRLQRKEILTNSRAELRVREQIVQCPTPVMLHAACNELNVFPDIRRNPRQWTTTISWTVNFHVQLLN